MRYWSLITFFISAGFALPSLAFAFFCPTNFRQIDYGFTISQVLDQCGKPDKQEETKKANENVPQEWTYYAPQNYTTTGPTIQPQGSIKNQIAFDSEGRVVNISSNGFGIGVVSMCGINIQLGMTREQIKSACGNPVFSSKQDTPTDGSAPPPDNVITTFTYNTSPPTKLIFENGKLTEKQ